MFHLCARSCTAARVEHVGAQCWFLTRCRLAAMQYASLFHCCALSAWCQQQHCVLPVMKRTPIYACTALPMTQHPRSFTTFFQSAAGGHLRALPYRLAARVRVVWGFLLGHGANAPASHYQLRGGGASVWCDNELQAGGQGCVTYMQRSHRQQKQRGVHACWTMWGVSQV